MARSKSCTIASSISAQCWRTSLAQARISSDEIGLRFCGMVLLAPRPCSNGSNTSPNSVDIIIITSLAIFASEPVEQAGEQDRLRQAVARHVPGDLGFAQAEFAHQRRAHRKSLVAERGEGAGSAAELAYQHARPQLRQALALARQRRAPHRRLVAEGHGQGVLQVGASGHGRIAVAARQRLQRSEDVVQVGLDQLECRAQLQHDRRVHDVLGGRAPVHVAAGVARAGGGELLHQRQDRVADDLGLALQAGEVEAGERRLGADFARGRGGNHADAGLGARQRRLHFQAARKISRVGKDRAHFRRAEHIAEQLGIEYG